MNATVADLIRSRVQIHRYLPVPAERRALREEMGLTQQELADVIGVTRQAVGHWESGKRSPSVACLEKYVAAIRALREAA